MLRAGTQYILTFYFAWVTQYSLIPYHVWPCLQKPLVTISVTSVGCVTAFSTDVWTCFLTYNFGICASQRKGEAFQQTSCLGLNTYYLLDFLGYPSTCYILSFIFVYEHVYKKCQPANFKPSLSCNTFCFFIWCFKTHGLSFCGSTDHAICWGTSIEVCCSPNKFMYACTKQCRPTLRILLFAKHASCTLNSAFPQAWRLQLTPARLRASFHKPYRYPKQTHRWKNGVGAALTISVKLEMATVQIITAVR